MVFAIQFITGPLGIEGSVAWRPLVKSVPLYDEIHKQTYCPTRYEAAGLCSNCWLAEPLASFEKQMRTPNEMRLTEPFGAPKRFFSCLGHN